MAKITESQISAMIQRLRRMQAPKGNIDDRGVYLGDGMPYKPEEELRSVDLADLLDEVLEARAK